ncbi:MAG: SpoIIE family protein phosphatase [Actinobacteria bacterium]|nr:SpoIIE family protein phosphatase [Actinomycetota bacterium]
MISPPETALGPASAEDAGALEALVAGARIVLDRRPVAEALVAIARAAADATGSEAAIVRVGSEDGDLVARAVHTRSAALASELEGSRLAASDTPYEETDYATRGNGSAPPAIRRAAARSGADAVRLVPVVIDGAVEATIELYRRGDGFSARWKALARLASAHIGLALELERAIEVSEAASQRLRTSLELAGDALAAGSDEVEAAEEIVRLACDATGASRSLLWRIEAEGRASFLAAHGFDGDPPDLDVAAEAVGRAVEHRGDGGGAGDAPAVETARTVLLGEPPVGALQLLFEREAPDEDGEHLSAFAARAAVALRRTRRAQLVTLALRRSQTIVAVISQAIARLSLSHTLETAVERISELTASAHVAIYLREGGRLGVAAARGLEHPHLDLAERLLEMALGPFRGRGFLFIDDMTRDSRLAGLEEVLVQTGVRRALVVPLVVRDEVIGALAVYKTRPRPYRVGEEGLLIALSSQLAVAVQNARLHERTKELGAVLERTLASERKAARQLRGLFQISHSFTRSLSLEATLDAVARTMVELLDLDAAAIRMPDGRGEQLVPRAIYVADPALREAAGTLLARPQDLSSPFVRGLVESGRPAFLSARDALGADGDDLLAPFLLKGSTAAVLPMATPGEVLGVLTLLSLDPARPLDEETVETAMAVTAQAALAIDNARLYQQQRDFAETMQRSLLPREIPSVHGLEVGHVYQSSARVDVGGDVYDFLSLEDGRLAVILGDVTGKGIQAAADMAMAKFSFRALARSYPDPPDFLTKANEVVIEEIAVGKFITMVYAVVDPETHEVAYASAGHPPARFVAANGKVSTLSASGLALGIETAQEYPAERTRLDPGASVVLFTDGLIEARREGDLYGEARLDSFLSEHAGLPAQELAEALLADCQAFAGGEVADDCAVVCLRLAA